MLNVARNEAGAPEIFRSIQGEGPHAGRERTFIRLSGCNLHCVWCDTAYTWNWLGSDFQHERDRPGRPFKFDPAKEMVKLDVADAADLILAEPSEGVVITGGEPLLQAGAVATLIDALRAHTPFLQIEIETNGSIAPDRGLQERVNLFVASPKLAHSGNDAALAMRGLQTFAALDNAVFKFVARRIEDVAEIAALARRAGLRPERIYVMPEGTDSDALRRRARELADEIVAHGFNFSDRLHIHLFGERRGV